jgi:excisionase family DNA binding protein
MLNLRRKKMREILTRREVSELFKMPIRTIDYLVASGQIPFSRLGKRSVRFSKERLEKWFYEREGVDYSTKKKNDREKS